MALTQFISTIWSETLYEELNKQYVAVSNCNRDFEGDIKEQGNKVKICGVGNISVFNYIKEMEMMHVDYLTDTSVELSINRSRAFNFQVDDIDIAQATPRLMQAAMRVAASALANDADQYVFSLFDKVAESNTIRCEQTTAENIIDHIIKAREMLYGGNVANNSEIVLEVSPQVASLILKAKISLSNDVSDSALSSGLLGTIAGCKIYVSNNICKRTDSNVNYYKCFMRTKRAIAFASQLSKIDAFRPEHRFCDAIKGLHLYGADIIYPKELVLLDLGISA